jgi:hypothetical protein
MDDFIALVIGAFGVRDFPVYIQLPHSPVSKVLAESLCHLGLRTVLGSDVRFAIAQNLLAQELSQGRSHFIISVLGAKTASGRAINTFQAYVQLPYSPNAKEAVKAMIKEGLRSYLGKWCQNITVTKCDETNAGLWEPVGADMRLN